MEEISRYLGAIGIWIVKICATVIALGVVFLTVVYAVSLLVPSSIQVGMLEWIGLKREAKTLQEKAMRGDGPTDAQREVFPDVYSVAGKLAECSGFDVYWLVPSEFQKAYESTMVEQQGRSQQTQASVQSWQVANQQWLQQLSNLAPQDQQEQWTQLLRQWQASLQQQRTVRNQRQDYFKAETRLMQLNYAIGRQRVEERGKIQESYWLWQISTLSSIMIGMLTTVLVSLNAAKILDEDRSYSKLMRILAILFPAVGTALAAAMAFYSPQATWSQSSRKLADLSQLHSQMTLGMWNLDCKSVNYERDLDREVEGWAGRFANIQTAQTNSQVQSKVRDKGQTENTEVQQPRLPASSTPQQPGN